MRKILSVVAITLGLLVVPALAAELMYGSWFSTKPLDRLGLARNADTAVSAASLYADGGDFTYRRDRWGFRGAGTEPGQITVLAVGGDTTDQFYLPDDATWPAVMERELRANGRDAVVANAGLDGQGTSGHVRAMEDWFPNVPGLKPRFILFYVGVNDVQAGADADTVPAVGRIEWLRRHSALWQAAARLAGAVPARQDRPNHQRVDFADARWTDKPAAPDWRETTIPAYQDRLHRLAAATHGMGAVPVFITQTRADFKSVDGRVLGMIEADGRNGLDHYRHLTAFNRATREVCADEGLLCLDLARELTFEPGDFYDHLHNTPQGAEKIGRWLAHKLAGLV